jgi:hypothetical protein
LEKRIRAPAQFRFSVLPASQKSLLRHAPGFLKPALALCGVDPFPHHHSYHWFYPASIPGTIYLLSRAGVIREKVRQGFFLLEVAALAWCLMLVGTSIFALPRLACAAAALLVTAHLLAPWCYGSLYRD